MIKDFGDFYSRNSKMKWIISLLVIISIVFSIGYVNIIINDIKEREKNTIELYASSIEYLANYENDINTDFFSFDFSKKLKKKYGEFKLITANNVFAHSPHLLDFSKGIKNILSPKGVFVVEVSYLDTVIKKKLLIQYIMSI